MGIYTDLQELAKEDPDQAVRECILLLDKNPDDSLALFLMGSVYAESERFGMAANLFRRVCDIRPEKPEAWNNLGMAYEGMKDHKQSLKLFRKAWDMEQRANFASNVGNAYLSQQDYKKALDWAHKANKIDPKAGRSVIAMASLSLNDWATGWDNYEATIGGKFRKELQFQEECRWDGTNGKRVVVYGEQGIGDEVMYASCVPDIAKDNDVILECDPRLYNLFKRSFPQCDVYGTRREAAPWLEKYQIDARCAVGTLPKFYRRTPESFPGTPYLKPDPERVAQWKALWKRKTIGICWSGGSKHNRWQERAIGLEAFRSLIENTDADFVSLQYKDPTGEIEETGLPVKHYKRATMTDDYDDTAGLVASLDMVVGVHTSVHHLAGALGVPGVILVPDKTLWLYANEFPWYKSAQLFRQKPGEAWADTIGRLHDSAICRI